MQGPGPHGGSPEPGPRPDYRHAWPVAALVGALLLVGGVVRALAVPPTFGELGYFRAASVPQEAAPDPRYLGSPPCADCHDEEVALHAKDTHATVACETCHGPGTAHVAEGGEAPLATPDRPADCLTCHLRLVARPATFPQIDRASHYALVGVGDPTTACVDCHSPHEPLFLDQDLRDARRHPLIHRCRDCHPGRTDETLVRPAGHPAIFECRYCHPAVVEDFETRAHAGLRCTTCHLFIKDTDFSGRIVRDSDPRFCLLCHGEADFRADTAPPQVSWPSHRDDMALGPEDDEKRCVDCHRDRIHRLLKELPR